MTEIFVNNIIVDIEKDMAMSLNFAIADILQPDKRNTAFSKTLKLPGTKTNNKLFGHIFEISKEVNSYDSQVNFTLDFNPNLKASCKIFQENLLQFNGIIQLVQVTRLMERYEYEVVVYGTLRNLITAFEGLKLEDIDLSRYDHAFTRDRMVESWATKIQLNGSDYVNFSAGQPNGRGYVYPIIDYGYTQSLLKLRLDKTYPAVYVYEYLTQMFYNAGFTWTSTFFESNLFKRLIIPFNKKKTVITATDITNRSFKASTSIQRTYVPPSGSVQLITNQKPIFDNDSTGGNFDTTNQWNNGTGPVGNPAFCNNGDVTSTAVFTVLKKGNYDLEFDIQILLEFFQVGGVTPKNDSGEIIINVVRTNSSNNVRPINGKGIITGTGDALETNVSSVTYNTLQTIKNVPLQAGDKIFLNVNINRYGYSLLPNTDSKITVSSANYFKATAVTIPVTIGDTMPVNAVIPLEIEQKEFFMSIVKMFNLYVQPDPDNDANLLIETLVDFYEGNSVEDWSDKVDYGKEILIKPISSIEGKDYIFKYKPDNDFYNKDHRDNFDTEYGERNISIANDFLKGKKTFELIFSPTPSVGALTNEMVVPRIVTVNEETGAVLPYQGNIRILYYGGVLSCGGNFKWVAQNGTTTLYTQTTYAYAGHLDHPFTPTLDLLFAIPKTIYWGAPSNIGSNYTNNNLFNKYYGQFIDEITDRNSKIVTMWVRLRPIDVFKLNFKNFIHIDGINYRLNRVIDYNPIGEGVCKIELTKIKRGFTFVPFDEEIEGGTAGDPLKFDLVEGGKDEVRSLSAYSYAQLIDGSLDSVININGISINVLNGGKD
jgi:hypothetical protein